MMNRSFRAGLSRRTFKRRVHLCLNNMRSQDNLSSRPNEIIENDCAPIFDNNIQNVNFQTENETQGISVPDILMNNSNNSKSLPENIPYQLITIPYNNLGLTVIQINYGLFDLVINNIVNLLCICL